MPKLKTAMVGGLLIGVVTSTAAFAGTVAVPRTLPVSPMVRVSEPIRECDYRTRIGESIAANSDEVSLVDSPATSGRRLDLKIVDVHAPSGGIWSGPKWITVEGKLLDDGRTLGNFTVKEMSMGGLKNCTILAKCARVIGEDIAGWLKAPSKNAYLGSAK